MANVQIETTLSTGTHIVHNLNFKPQLKCNVQLAFVRSLELYSQFHPTLPGKMSAKGT